jgi:hypothetical protein
VATPFMDEHDQRSEVRGLQRHRLAARDRTEAWQAHLSAALQGVRRQGLVARRPAILIVAVSPMLEILIRSRKRHWEWIVQSRAGITLVSGRAKTRIAAQHEAERALFELLRVTAAPRKDK